MVGCGNTDGVTKKATTTAPPTTGAPFPTVPRNVVPGGTPGPYSAVRVGQCLNDVAVNTQRDAATLQVGCEQAHRYEVYESLTYPIGGSKAPAAEAYPGETRVRNAAEQTCYERFPAFIGTDWTASEFDIQAWWPSATSWATTGDRNILCAVYLLGGGLTTGSVRGLAR